MMSLSVSFKVLLKKSEEPVGAPHVHHFACKGMFFLQNVQGIWKKNEAKGPITPSRGRKHIYIIAVR
jgi:hypothetical protein